MSNTVRDVILGRWKFPDIARLKPIRKDLDSVLNAHDAVRERHAEVAKNQNLSGLGKLDEVRGHVSKSTAPAIQRARATAKAERANLDAWRARLAPKPLDPSEQWLGTQMLTYIRGQSTAKASALLVSRDSDPTLIRAVLSVPSFLSGITDELRARVLDSYVSRTHPNDLAQIAQVEEAVDLLEAAVGVTFSAAKAVAEFPSEQLFSDFIDKSAPLAPSAPGSASDSLLQKLGEIKLVDNPLHAETPEEMNARFLAEARVTLAAAGLI